MTRGQLNARGDAYGSDERISSCLGGSGGFPGGSGFTSSMEIMGRDPISFGCPREESEPVAVLVHGGSSSRPTSLSRITARPGQDVGVPEQDHVVSQFISLTRAGPQLKLERAPNSLGSNQGLTERNRNSAPPQDMCFVAKICCNPTCVACVLGWWVQSKGLARKTGYVCERVVDVFLPFFLSYLQLVACQHGVFFLRCSVYSRAEAPFRPWRVPGCCVSTIL